MQKLEEGQALAYPIDLYLSKKQIMLVLALGLLLFPLYFYGIPWAQEKDDWIALLCIWFFIIVIFLGLVAILLSIIKAKPVLQITDKGLVILQVLKIPQQRHILWEDIYLVGMDYRVISRQEIWLLLIQPYEGKTIQYPIKSMRYKNFILNEMEIINLVKHAFEGDKILRYQPIEMQRMQLITQRAKWLFYILLVLCILFYLFYMV